MSRVEVIAVAKSSGKSLKRADAIASRLSDRGVGDVRARAAASTLEASEAIASLWDAGSRVFVAADAGDALHAVLDGCMSREREDETARVGFVSGGSSEPLGDAVRLPRDDRRAVDVLADAIAFDRSVRCDVLRLDAEDPESCRRHFIGYLGAESFGRIPYFAGSGLVRASSGLIGPFLGGDLRFRIAAVLASFERGAGRLAKKARDWSVEVDGRRIANRSFHAIVVVNGDLGPSFPMAAGEPLGDGVFHVFGIAEGAAAMFRGNLEIPAVGDGAAPRAAEHYVATELRFSPDDGEPFTVSVDGAAVTCRGAVRVTRAGALRVLTGDLPQAEGDAELAVPEGGAPCGA